MNVPSSTTLSLHDLMSTIPNIKPAINALPSTLRNILSARVQSLVFEPISKKLKVTLQMNTLTLVPKIITLNKLEVFLHWVFKPKAVVQSSHTADSVRMQMSVEQNFASQFGLHRSPLTSPLQETADAQVVNVEVLRIKGEWAIQGLRFLAKVNYKLQTKELYIEGISHSAKANGVSVSDLIKGLSGAGLSVPSVISSLRVKKVTGSSKDGSTTVILSASSASSDVYLVFQKLKTSTAVALAAEIKDFKLSELIKLATGIDISSVPFLGPFKIDFLAYSVSTREILTPLLSTTYDSDSPLRHYGNKLPKGLTSHFVAEIGGKQGIQISYAQKVLEFRIPKSKELSLQGLLSEIPSMSAATKALPSPLSDLLSSKLVVFHFHSSTKQISVSAKLASLALLPRVVRLRNLQLSFKMNLGARKDITFLMFSADWMLQGVSITTKVSYDRSSNSILFSATPKRNGQMNIQQLIKGLSGMNIPIPSIINSASLTKIIGRKTADVFTFIFSCSVAGKANVHLIYRNSGAASTFAIAALIKSFKLSELVKSAVRIDVTSVPFFGTFSVPSMAMVISRDDLTVPLLSKVFASKFLLAKYGTRLPKGFSVRFDAAIGRARGVAGSYANKVISFIVPPRTNVPLTSLFSVIDVKSLALPSVFGDFFRIQLKKFIFDIQKKQAVAEIFLGKINIFKNALSIKSTHLRLTAKLSTPKRFSAEARGIITLGKKDYGAKVWRDSKTRKYVLSVKTKKLPIFGIITQFGATFLPGNIKKMFGKVFNVYILDARIVYPFGAKPHQIMISGTPHIFGLKTAHMTSVVMQHQQDTIMILKIKFGKIHIADTIKKLVGVSLHKIAILNQNVNLELTISPVGLKRGSLSIPEFHRVSIDKGVSIKASLGWPSGCTSDAFCALAKKLLGGAKLSLQVAITNPQLFTMRAAIQDLKLGAVVLRQAGLEIVSGSEQTIGLVGEIQLNKPPVTLSAAIRLTTGGIKLVGSMSGCWHKAFGFPYVSICNLFLAMALAPTPVGLEFGGRIEVGKKSCGKVFVAEGYIGINTINPIHNYIYADIGPITFQKFLEVFCLSVKLPRPLGDTGYPDGIKMSYSLLGKELPHAKISET